MVYVRLKILVCIQAQQSQLRGVENVRSGTPPNGRKPTKSELLSFSSKTVASRFPKSTTHVARGFVLVLFNACQH